MPTKKQIIDDIIILATRFGVTDDTRLDETYIGFKVEQIRASKIIEEYNYTGIIDQNWLVDFGTKHLGVKLAIVDTDRLYIPTPVS